MGRVLVGRPEGSFVALVDAAKQATADRGEIRWTPQPGPILPKKKNTRPTGQEQLMVCERLFFCFYNFPLVSLSSAVFDYIQTQRWLAMFQEECHCYVKYCLFTCKSVDVVLHAGDALSSEAGGLSH